MSPCLNKEQMLLQNLQNRGFSISISGSDESINAYSSRKVETMSPFNEEPDCATTSASLKISVSEPISFTPAMPPTGLTPQTNSQIPTATFLPMPQLHNNQREVSCGSKLPKSKVIIESTPVEFEFCPALEHSSLICVSISRHVDPQSNHESGQESQRCCNEMEVNANSDSESGHYQKSTLADPTPVTMSEHSSLTRFYWTFLR